MKGKKSERHAMVNLTTNVGSFDHLSSDNDDDDVKLVLLKVATWAARCTIMAQCSDIA